MPTVFDPRRVRRGGPLGEQADRGRRHLDRGVRRARPRRPGQHADADLELDAVRRLYGDPQSPDNGPFMEGAYLAHASTASSQNGGGLCWVVRVGSGDGAPTAAGRAPVGRRRRRRGVPRGGERRRSTPDVSLELTEESRRQRRRQGRGGRGSDPTQTYRLVVTAGAGARGVRRPDAQEGPQLHRHQGQRRLEADQARGDRAPRCPSSRASAPGNVHARRPDAGQSSDARAGDDFEGDVAKREGLGGLAAIDEITMVCVPRPR